MPEETSKVRPDLGVHLENIPNTSADYKAELQKAVSLAIANQHSGGSFEVAGKTRDLGDNSLGVSSFLALQFQQSGRKDTRVVAPFHQSLAWFLANRVYTKDDVGDLHFLRATNSGEPYAKYEPSATPTAPDPNENGDWPTTVWALLHVGNILADGHSLLTQQERSSLISLGLGYWRWLTQVAYFNPQDADNQAIASVDGAIQLAKQMESSGMKQQSRALYENALNVYQTQVRPLRETDRGYIFYPEHSGGFDQNYGAISISFLWRGWTLTHLQMFYNDGLQMARYLDMRLSARGFDYGGPRHNEDHSGFPAVYGLCAYSNILHDDLGRYLGNPAVPYYAVTNGLPDGHFAFMTVWEMSDRCTWYTRPATVNNSYKMRSSNTSVVLTSALAPYLVTAGGDDVIDAAASGSQGMGLAYSDGGSVHLMTEVPGTRATEHNLSVPGVLVKVVTATVEGPGGVAIPTRTAYLLDGSQVRVMTSASAPDLPAGITLSYVAGLPYLTTDPEPGTPPDVQQQKVLGVGGIASQATMSFGQDGATLHDATGITAGPMAITSASGVTVTNPPGPASNDFSDSATLGKTLEHYSAGLNGNPNAGWAMTQQTNLVQIPAQPAAGTSLMMTDVTYGPTGHSEGLAMKQAIGVARAALLSQG